MVYDIKEDSGGTPKVEKPRIALGLLHSFAE